MGLFLGASLLSLFEDLTDLYVILFGISYGLDLHYLEMSGWFIFVWDIVLDLIFGWLVESLPTFVYHNNQSGHERMKMIFVVFW